MELREAASELRKLLAPHLDDYSLELLDIEIEEQDWPTAYGMAIEAARFRDVSIPEGLLAHE